MLPRGQDASKGHASPWPGRFPLLWPWHEPAAWANKAEAPQLTKCLSCFPARTRGGWAARTRGAAPATSSTARPPRRESRQQLEVEKATRAFGDSKERTPRPRTPFPSHTEAFLGEHPASPCQCPLHKAAAVQGPQEAHKDLVMLPPPALPASSRGLAWRRGKSLPRVSRAAGWAGGAASEKSTAWPVPTEERGWDAK